MTARASSTPLPTAVQAPAMLAAAKGRARFFLRDGADTFVGLGSAGAVDGHGPSRFADTKAAAELLLAGRPGARLVGGFAFDEHPSAAWGAFPAAHFWLPEELWHWHGAAAPRVVRVAARKATVTAAPPATWPDGATPAVWADRVGQALRAIKEGTVAKVVLSRTYRAHAADPVLVVERLLAREKDTQVFLVEPVAGQALVGATPERLVDRQANHITTHALAGSAPRGKTADDDKRIAASLLASPKNRLEHDLVVGAIGAGLLEAGAASVAKAARRVRKLRTIQHIETPIMATIKGRHILDIAKVLHPTPAVAGSPRDASLRLIGEMEGFPRGWYTGGVGWFNAEGDGSVSVALRCALMTQQASIVFAGAGIVAASDAATEWRETEAKMRSMLQAIKAARGEA